MAFIEIPPTSILYFSISFNLKLNLDDVPWRSHFVSFVLFPKISFQDRVPPLLLCRSDSRLRLLLLVVGRIPNGQLSETPRNARYMPKNCGFLPPAIYACGYSLETSMPDALRIERNSIMPTAIKETPTISRITPKQLSD